MKSSQSNVSPLPEGQSPPTPKTLDDLKKLNPRTQAVILGKAKDAKHRSRLKAEGGADAAYKEPAA